MAGGRQVAEQLRRFLSTAENPSSAQSANLSEAGFLLLSLKEQLLANDQRSDFFLQEFTNRPVNGVDLLVRTIVVLQGIVNSSGSSSKISNILTRTNSAGNRKRKAAVVEADSIECLKILLEKSNAAWRALLESATSLEVILYSVNSPQLDSKCYALEILLLLLDQPQGFSILWRALTVLAARNRDYVRLTLFVLQLKHGLHTSKLHIQILVVRLLNKLLAQAPSHNHRLLAQVEAALAQFSPDYLEKVVLELNTPLGGLDTLLEELSIFRSLSAPVNPISNVKYDDRNIYGYTHSESDSDSAKARRLRNNFTKFSAPTAVAKSVERQRLRKAESSQGGSGRGSGLANTGGYYPYRQSHTLSNTFDPHNDEMSYQSPRHVDFDTRTTGGGGMRRAKSESAMLFDDMDTQSTRGGLKRIEQSEYHPIQTSKNMSRSIHDLTRQPPLWDDRTTNSLMRPPRPPSAGGHNTRSLQRTLSPPRARFADPPIIDSQQPHAGFSYLFPAAPVLSSVVPKRAITPTADPKALPPPSHQPLATSQSLVRPSSTLPSYDRDRASELSPNSSGGGGSGNYSRPEGQVTYIPINVEDESKQRTMRYEKRRPNGEEEGGAVSARRRGNIRSPSGTIGEDVRDALSQFDYLNEYEAGSPKPRGNTGYRF